MSAWDEVDQWAAEQRKRAHPDQSPKAPKAPLERRPMTEDERELAAALAHCSFTPGSFDKRFARNMGGLAASSGPVITEKQAALLRKLVTRYRRQIRPASIPESERHLLVKPKGGTCG